MRCSHLVRLAQDGGVAPGSRSVLVQPRAIVDPIGRSAALFYRCQGCAPEEINDSFAKLYSPWYDDDYISKQVQKQNYDGGDDRGDGDDGGSGGGNDGRKAAADNASYYQQNGDGTHHQPNNDTHNYAPRHDAVAGNSNDATDYYSYADAAAGDDDGSNHYVNTDKAVYYMYKPAGDNFYGMDDNGNRILRRSLHKDVSYSLSAMDAREVRRGVRVECDVANVTQRV